MASNSSGLRFENSSFSVGLALGVPSPAFPPKEDTRIPRTITTIYSNAPVSTAIPAAESSRGMGISRQLSKRIPFLGRSKSKRVNLTSSRSDRTSTDAGVSGTVATAAPSSSNTQKPRSSQTFCRFDNAIKLTKRNPRSSRSVADPISQPSNSTAAWSRPLLEVEIPDTKLERYSVMFSNLFEEQQSSGDLLARRQATVARLKAIQDEVQQDRCAQLHRTRRATSTMVSPPYISALTEVAEVGRTPAAPNMTPLRLRSNTDPVIREIAYEDAIYTGKTSSPRQALPQSSASQLLPGQDDEEWPRLRSKFHKLSIESKSSPYGSQPSNNNTANEAENITMLSPPGYARRLQEMSAGASTATTTAAAETTSAYVATPKMSEMPSRTASLRRPAGAAISLPPTQRRSSKDSNNSNDGNVSSNSSNSNSSNSNSRNGNSRNSNSRNSNSRKTAQQQHDDAVEVSIARQISISRQQRKLLEPLRERELRRARAKNHMHAASQVSIDDTGRVAETRTAMPKLIHHLHTHQESPQNLHRRSERVTVEGT